MCVTVSDWPSSGYIYSRVSGCPLQDYHQQLERERADRRQSDAKATKLLEEVKVHSETLRKLRKDELRCERELRGRVVQI